MSESEKNFDAEEAFALIQEFKTRWMELPVFANKLPHAVRVGMTSAHTPIFQLEEMLRAEIAKATS